MSQESTRATLESYMRGHDLDLIADDAVYTVMGTGQKAEGRDAVQQLLQSYYQQAFDAQADVKNVVVGDGKAAVEYIFMGRHIGEFAGIQPTGKQVEVPMCVVYEARNGQIQKADIYFEMDTLRHQLGQDAGS